MRFRFTLSFLALVFATTPILAIERAGELFVDLDAATFDVNAATWTNAGSYGDFNKVGNPGLLMVGSAPAVTFDGVMDAFVGSAVAPADVTFFEARSIEAWVYNPSIANEETIVSWGKRGGPDGTNLSFNYGTNGAFGAVGHWGAPDLGWNDAGGAPEPFQWHHLTYTYDQDSTRVYADGALANQEATVDLFGDLETFEDTAIAIASQWEGTATIDNVGDPAFLTPGLKGSLGIGRMRIHGEALTAEQILANYNEEKGSFESPVVDIPEVGDPVPRPLNAPPIHRYRFDNPAGDANPGAEFTDSIGGAHGAVVGDGATFTGSALRLPGGASDVAPYGDLPNGIISGLTDTTIEAWVTVEGAQNWSRVFDFGSNSPGGENGELSDVGDDNGGNTEGLDYLMLSATRGGDANLHRIEIRNVDPAGGGITTLDATIEKLLPDEGHYTVVYDSDGIPDRDFLGNIIGAAPAIRFYYNGELMGEAETDIELADMNDVNNWLGRSNWTNDANLEGSFDEFRIYDYAITSDQALGNFEAGPDTLNVVLEVPGDCNGDGVVDAADLACVSTLEERDIVLAAIPTLAGDLDGNGDVAFPDFLVLSANFGQDLPSYTAGNIDLDGGIAFPDFLILSANFGQVPVGGATASSVPEPASVVLLLIGSLWFVRYRGRRPSWYTQT